ncbi:MAG: metalloregulator ArsR/SmtB family transcription factor [Collinsella sp.]|nr:metalloregulator ArsR/SmtB family transcription factor [Collinsella sp.]
MFIDMMGWQMDLEQMAAACKALGDPRRLQIVRALAAGERCACELLEGVGVAQPTLSHHMKALCASGLVRSRREGKWMFYRLDRDAFDAFRQTIGALGRCEPAGEGTDERKRCCDE